ncbi:flagellar hook protein FlgE [Psychromonas sp. KJ10-10]|uniref:flagellar hook protein FlgE n=1 Tax=Psychromonas sp. KJ10-10 TaxID=3391823 RepID=UPI0039B6AD31
MSFNIALSGISVAQTDLDTTANNVANVGTVGFKESRAEFESVYASSLFTNNATKVGDGASVSSVAQQFHQGSLKFTQNPLDLAITGSGFFATAGGLEESDLSYTRAGAFKLDNQNYIVDNDGNYLQAFPVNADGTSSSVSLSTTGAIAIPETAGTPVQTSEINMTLNLPSGEEELDPANFDPDDPETYTGSTSVTIYDSLGGSHIASTYYIKPENATYSGTSNWVSFVEVDGVPVDPTDGTTSIAGTYGVDDDGDGAVDAVQKTASYTDADGNTHNGVVLSFNSIGGYSGSSPATLTYESLGIDGANVLDASADGDQSFTINYDDPTQFDSSFEVTSLEQDGLTVGRLTGVEIADDGLVQASYSNGTSEALARVAIVRFRNEQGLTQSGSTWTASQTSGDPIAGEADSGSFGSINSAALEQSNVNLTTELVDLITAQRNFQANSRALEINNTLQQTILQIR